MFWLAPEGRKPIYFTFLLSISLSLLYSWYSLPLWGIFFMVLFFFRDPERDTPGGENLIVSPADGKVIEIKDIYEGKFLKSQAKKVSIFMSLFNVHVNRSPIDGKVTYRDYVRGMKKPAFKAGSSNLNERSYLGIEGKIRLLLVQVAGFVARRIVTYPKIGDALKAGERIGIIKLGSRVELYLPLNVEVVVKVGDRVRAGETILGVVKDNEDESKDEEGKVA